MRNLATWTRPSRHIDPPWCSPGRSTLRDAELLLHTFWALIDFLPPSEESVALAKEMASNLIERREMYHPMRAADAAYRLALAELDFAEIAPRHMDSAIDGSTRRSDGSLTVYYFHDKSQELSDGSPRCCGRSAATPRPTIGGPRPTNTKTGNRHDQRDCRACAPVGHPALIVGLARLALEVGEGGRMADVGGARLRIETEPVEAAADEFGPSPMSCVKNCASSSP